MGISVEHYSAHTPWGRSSGQPPANSQILQPTVSVGAFPEFALLAGTFASFSGACWQLLLILPSTLWTCFSPAGPNKDKVAAINAHYKIWLPLFSSPPVLVSGPAEAVVRRSNTLLPCQHGEEPEWKVGCRDPPMHTSQYCADSNEKKGGARERANTTTISVLRQ